MLDKMTARAALVVATALLILGAPVGAQGNPITDLMVKGKRALNDFNYRQADTVWHQLLTQPLSRQQRIDVLQLLAATIYPDDAAEQKPDSAAAIVRQLVGMGVSRMVVRDVSWRGLDSLYTAVARQSPGVAQASLTAPSYDSAREVIALIGDYQVNEIVDRVTIDCSAFAFDEVEVAARRTRTHQALPDALKRTCSQLLVESDPPNTQLTVGARDFGIVPDRGQLRWVRPEPSVEVAVARGQSRAAKVVEFPQGKMLHVRFFLPKDTLTFPAVKSVQEIAEELRVFSNFTPSTQRPPPPTRPRSMGAFASGMIWGIVGGGLGFAAGQFLPFAGCNVPETVPSGQTWRVRGQLYTAGQEANLGAGMPCVATVAGGTGFSMLLIGAITKSSKNKGAMRRYNEATAAYPTALREWEQRERTTFAERHPDVRQALADQQTKIAQTRAENDNIRARNRNLPEPEATVREFGAQPSGATMAPPSAGTVTSDVDLRVPSAAAPNPDAVAIVIGNRDYQTAGVPKAENAVRDAVSMKRYLVEAFGFAENRVILDTAATAGRMNDLFGRASDASQSRLVELVGEKPNDVDVFVFYSGHGGTDGRPAKRFLLPLDGNPRRLSATGYPLDLLYKNLTALKARSVTVAIDAGFGSLSDAGSLIANQSFGGAIELEVGTVGGANTQVYLATSADQTARWRRDQGHGLFTYYFLKGIQGSADSNGDNAITAAELETYVKSNVRSYAADRMTGAQQLPEVFTNNPRRPVVTLKPAF